MLVAAFALFTPPKFRSRPSFCVAGTYSSDDWEGETWRERQEEDAEKQRGYDRRWLSLSDCDVLPPAEGVPCAGIVHFVGGAFVGTTPRLSYAAFLEDLSDAANVCIVATPVAGLTGLDHNAAATEVMLRWCSALPDVHQALDVRAAAIASGSRAAASAGRSSAPAPAASLPVLGIGHSLGAKLLILLGSDPGMSDNLGPRAANVLVSYNSYSAKRSVPLLSEASNLGGAALQNPLTPTVASGLSQMGEVLGAGASGGLRALGETVRTGEVADALDAGIGSLTNGLLGLGSQMGLGVGGGGELPKGSQAQQLAGTLEDAARAVGAFGQQVGARGRDVADAAAAADVTLNDEFTPSPEETQRRAESAYRIGRNLLLRFETDDIDQSPGLGRVLRTRFCDPNTGLGGRIDLKTLPGTHVTPNTPRIGPFLAGIGGSRDLAEQLGVADAADGLLRAESERQVASEAVAEFVRRELDRAAAQ